MRRIDFPYRLAGRRAPDRPAVLVATVVEEAGSLAQEAGLAPERIFVGGRSMGGRICSMAVAGGMPAAGLVLVSYPLHPPGRPDRLRTEHFGPLDLPCLFVSGTSDAFAAPAELEAEVAAIPGTGHGPLAAGRRPWASPPRGRSGRKRCRPGWRASSRSSGSELHPAGDRAQD